MRRPQGRRIWFPSPQVVSVTTRKGPLDNSFADLDAFVDNTADARLADYLDLLRLPSIGAQSEHTPDVRATAEFVAERFEKIKSARPLPLSVA